MAKGGFPGGMNMQSMMRQAQQMQAKMQQVQEDLDALCEFGYVRIESRHEPLHRRVEKTIILTSEGRDAGDKVLDAERYRAFTEKEADQTEIQGNAPPCLN